MSDTFKTLLSELANAFERRTRGDGSTFVTRKDDAPVWITSSVIREMYPDDRMPCDWVYESIHGIAQRLIEYDDPADEDNLHEVCDGMVDIYTKARLEWLADSLHNLALCDEAIEEGLCAPDASTEDRIGGGQYVGLQRIAGAVVAAVQTEADERDSVEVSE